MVQLSYFELLGNNVLQVVELFCNACCETSSILRALLSCHTNFAFLVSRWRQDWLGPLLHRGAELEEDLPEIIVERFRKTGREEDWQKAAVAEMFSGICFFGKRMRNK